MEKIEITADNITDVRRTVYEANGATAEAAIAKAENAAAEFASIPLEGKIVEIGTKTNEMKDKNGDTIVRTSIGVYLEGGAFVSENRFAAANVTKNPVKVKSVKNAGKYMLEQERISTGYYGLAASADKRLIALIGKTYKAEKITGLKLKEYEPEIMFAAGSLTVTQAKEHLLKNTEPTTYLKFEIQ